MALPANGLTSTMCRLPQKISDTFLRRANNSVMQIAGITGNTRRSKSAVPGWYKRMSVGSNNVSSDTQHAGMSPSSRYVTSYKNGALVKSALKSNDMVPKQYLINHLNSLSRSHLDIPKQNLVCRARSLPRWKEMNTTMDRESDQIASRDVKSYRSCSSSMINRSAETSENLENTLPTTEVEHDKAESLQTMEEAIMGGAEMVPSAENKALATSFKRTVNINLNDLNPVMAEAKKTLSMDINVIVSVKPPENGHKPEIGFQELPGKESEYETRKHVKSRKNGTIIGTVKPIETEIAENLKITSSEETENLKFGSERCLFSQKDLTEEIGKVYNFLKTNDGTQSISINNNQISSNMFQNYDAVKKLYVNALGCVKACQELKNNVAAQNNDSDPEISEIVSELEECFLTDDNCANSIGGFENSINHQGSLRKPFLSGITTDTMGIRMYSSKSDCEKATKLPCLQSSELSTGGDQNATGKSVCEKLCMPCCKPARDPPRCFYPYHKPPCKKLKAPRPAFSECKQLFEMKQVSPCECVRPRETRCKKSEDSATCNKR